MTKPRTDQTCKRCGLHPKIPGRGQFCESCSRRCARCGVPTQRTKIGSYRKWCAPCRAIAEPARATCSKCGAERDGSHKSYCRACYRAYENIWNRRNPDKVALKDRRRALKMRYGMTLDDYNRLLASQGGGCAVCGTVESILNAGPRGPKLGLHVDHDHRCCPGEVTCGNCIRGILCASCNNAAGRLKDVPALARRLAEYLTR